VSPVWWPVAKVRVTGELPAWQSEAIYRIAAKWEQNPLREFLGLMFVVLPGRIVIFAGCLLLVPLGLILGSVQWCRAPFTMLGRWYW
jgi:hypothetical protein